MKKEYLVDIPITGFVTTYVTASSEEEAVKMAMKEDFGTGDIAEWGKCKKITEGKVFHGTLNEVDAQEND